jgi:predicted extracellular nuclease
LSEYYVSWWNLENLFDIETAPRSDKLKRSIQSELKGWNQKVLENKLSQLSKIILQMNEQRGPDILGICEVESESVLKKLVNKINLPERKYKIAHEDTKDGRGIDVAFIYDSNKFVLKKQFSQWVLKRNATRDIFQINLKIKNSEVEVVCVGNHWPARIGGVYETEPYRIIAAETLSYFHQRIAEEMGKNTPILVMGDFNDEPFDRAIIDYALGSSNKGSVSRSKSPKLFNPMWKLVANGQYTHVYGSEYTMLDQFMVSKGLLQKKGELVIRDDSITVGKFKENSTGKKPKRFGRPSKKSSFNDKGYSDHFPISIKIIEK